MERLVERMKIAGIVPCTATFLETLESFSLSSGSEENFPESAVEISTDDDGGNGVDANVDHDDVDAFGGSEDFSSYIPNLSSDKDE